VRQLLQRVALPQRIRQCSHHGADMARTRACIAMGPPQELLRVLPPNPRYATTSVTVQSEVTEKLFALKQRFGIGCPSRLIELLRQQALG
jgi:hypothetical protein